MEQYRGKQYRCEIKEFSPHADKTPLTFTFKDTNRGHFAEDLVKFIIEHKLASPDEVRLLSFKYEPNARNALQRFFRYMRETIASDPLFVNDKNFKAFDREATESILKDIQNLEDKLNAKIHTKPSEHRT